MALMSSISHEQNEEEGEAGEATLLGNSFFVCSSAWIVAAGCGTVPLTLDT